MDKVLENVPCGDRSCRCDDISVIPTENVDKRGREGKNLSGRCKRLSKDAEGFGTVLGFLDIRQNTFRRQQQHTKEEMMMITRGTRGQ